MFTCFGNKFKFVNYDDLDQNALVPNTELVVKDNKGRETTGKILFGTFGPNEFTIYLNDNYKDKMIITKVGNTFKILKNGPKIPQRSGMRGGKTRNKNKRNKSTRRKLIRRRSQCKKCKK